MDNKQVLKSAHIKYLMALKKLNNPKGTRCSDIARELQVSKVSAHKMMENFNLWGYAHKESGGHVFLTEYGMNIALEYEVYYKKLKESLFSKHADNKYIDNAIFAFLAELPKNILVTIR